MDVKSFGSINSELCNRKLVFSVKTAHHAVAVIYENSNGACLRGIFRFRHSLRIRNYSSILIAILTLKALVSFNSLFRHVELPLSAAVVQLFSKRS